MGWFDKKKDEHEDERQQLNERQLNENQSAWEREIDDRGLDWAIQNLPHAPYGWEPDDDRKEEFEAHTGKPWDELKESTLSGDEEDFHRREEQRELEKAVQKAMDTRDNPKSSKEDRQRAWDMANHLMAQQRTKATQKYMQRHNRNAGLKKSGMGGLPGIVVRRK